MRGQGRKIGEQIGRKIGSQIDNGIAAVRKASRQYAKKAKVQVRKARQARAA
jgi:hypothetical protein